VKYKINVIESLYDVKVESLDCLNDTQKQQLAEKLINAFPVTLNNQVVEYILQKSGEDDDAPFSYDDITNNTPYANIEITKIDGFKYWVELDQNEASEKLEFFEYLRNKSQEVLDNVEYEDGDNYTLIEKWEKIVHNLDVTCGNLEHADFENYPEIYQWFSCSDYLIYKLEEYGECTLDGEYWGRTCCGQSITLDRVIQKIAFDYFKEEIRG
jgi:hypothetical protein